MVILATTENLKFEYVNIKNERLLYKMDEGTGLKKILKWAGLLAIIALPVIVLLKKRKNCSSDVPEDDESNIFTAELEE